MISGRVGDAGPKKPSARSGEEGGFILVWTALLILPVITIGFILLSYGQSNIAKIRAQLNAMNLAAIGTTSAEFAKSGESLQAMAMLARAQGFTGAQPVETVQNLSSGLLIFNHDTDASGENKIAVFQRYTLPPLTSLVSSLGNISTSGVARAKPSKLFVSVALDYSRSLLADFNISDLLRAFDVIDAQGERSNNGEFGPGNQIYPIPPVQNALPQSINNTPRYWHSWNTVGAVWPDHFWQAPSAECIPGSENGCGGSLPAHIGAIMYSLTNNFMMYKRAATILLGVLAQHTRYIDVNILGAPLPDRAWQGFLKLTQPPANQTPPPEANFERINSTANAIDGEGGVYPVFRYDEPTVTDIHPRAGGGWESPPMLAATVEYKNSFDRPKNLLTDNMSVSPTRILFLNLMSVYRKALTYQLFSHGNETYSFALLPPASASITHLPSALRYFLPAIPSGFNDPGDSFPHFPGAVNPIGGLPNEYQYPFGWPAYPSPPFASSGRAYPTNDELPDEIKTVREYRVHRDNSGSGPAKSNLALLSQNKWETGYGLCLMLDREDDGQQNNSVPCNSESATTPPLTLAQRVHYYRQLADPSINQRLDGAGGAPESLDPPLPTSPSCSDSGWKPRCKSPDGEPFDGGFVFCVHGYARCNPFSQMEVGCYNPTPPNGQREWSSTATITCDNDYASGRNPAGYYGLPDDRGTISVPTVPPTISDAHLLYFLMDLLPTYGGTFHQNSVPNSRCQDFRNRTDGTGRCAFVMLTDGVPNGRDFGGNVQVNTTDMITRLSSEMNLFTDTYGGRSFTWYLGRKDQLGSIIESARRSTLSPEQTSLIDLLEDPPSAGLNPDTECPIFDSIGTGITCSYLNQVVIPNHLADESAFAGFKGVMDGGTTKPERSWVETQLGTDASGAPSIGNAENPLSNDFLKGFRFLLALIKGSIVFDR